MKSYLKFLGMFLLMVCTLHAQDFNDALRLSDPGIISGPKSLGMGNAYTAISNDLSAAIFNPAGFGLIRKLQFDGALGNNSLSNNVTFFGNSTNASNSSTKLSQFGFAFPIPTSRGSLVFALGYNQLKDYNNIVKFDGYNPGNTSKIQDLVYSSNPDDNDFAYNLGLSYTLRDAQNKSLGDTTLINGKLNQSGSILSEGTLNSWYFGGAVEVEQNVFVGATINIITGTFKRTLDYWEKNLLNNYPSTLQLDPTDSRTAGFQSFYRNTILDWDISGWDAKIGMLAKVNDSFNLGASIRFPRTYTIKETYSVYGESDFTNTTFKIDPPIDYRSEYDITTPYEFTLGGSFKNDIVTLSADATMIDFTQMQFSSGLDQITREQNNNDIKSLFRTVYNLNAGAEVRIPNSGFAVRGGFMYKPSPYQGDPTDYDKKYVTVGLGYKTASNFSLNLAYSHGWWKDFGDNYGYNVSRTYQDITQDNFVMGVSYNF